MLVGIGGIAVYMGNHTAPEVYTAPSATTTVEVVEPESVDTIEQSRKELDRINQELDVEETKLLDEIAELEAQIEAKNKRIDSINELRTSF